MSLKETIMADVKEAMKSKEMEKLTVLRFIHSSIKNKEIEVRPNELTEETFAFIGKFIVLVRTQFVPFVSWLVLVVLLSPNNPAIYNLFPLLS